ncbi:MAG: dihydroorotase [Minwuia sp.]|uniref:dihydroorotase n=1 Tax=Minwuia sp. TaxID=2493630 RepID=UPI003A8A5AFD
MPAAAARAGGVTTLCTMPNTDPVIDNVALVEYVLRRANEGSDVHIRPFAAATQDMEGRQITEFGLLKAAGAVAFTDGDRAIADANVMRRALSYATAFDALIVQHAEEPSLAGGVMNAGALATRLGLTGIPSAAETIMVERDIRLVELTGGRYHAAHLTTAESLNAVRRAKQMGLKVSCGTAPHYFTLNEHEVNGYRTFAKVSPPLRSEDDRRAVVEAIRDGTIDVISSQHTPEDPEAKRQTFERAAHGVVGLETMLALGLQLHMSEGVPLLTVLACMTCNPARLLGLESGALEPGRPADLVVFDPAAPWIVDSKKFRSKSKNSPFDERPLQGHAVRTVVDGHTVFVRRVES